MLNERRNVSEAATVRKLWIGIGILALLALVGSKGERAPGRTGWLVGLAIFGAALLYGDGVITPSISVLSAIEGLTVATTALERWVDGSHQRTIKSATRA